MDSGFGPYSLTRLCYETGGIFFAVHPNRNENRSVSRQRDRRVIGTSGAVLRSRTMMRSYRPDYVSIKEYQKLVARTKPARRWSRRPNCRPSRRWSVPS